MYKRTYKAVTRNEQTAKAKKWEAALLAALCVTMLTGTWAQAKQTELASNLIRLHVVAVLDDAAEQSVKLKVRDGVIAYLAPRLEGASDAAEAENVISGSLDGIRAAAESRAGGRRVTVTLSDEYYPTRQYAGFSLPAGRYRSLRVILGDGGGHNWWCVIFPPLCLTAAGRAETQKVMSGSDFGIVTEDGGYAVKFRVLELWGQIMEKIN